MDTRETQTKQKIYEGLKRFRGSMRILAKEHGCSTMWIRQVLVDGYSDEALVLAASRLWLKLENERKQAVKQAIAIADQAQAIAIENDSYYQLQAI